MAFTIEDVNSRTLLQQFHSLYKRQEETDETVSNLSTDLDQEIQDRSNADADLADDIADLQRQLDSLGNIFTLKGSVATVADLPATDNNVGDVWYVISESTGYIWIDDNGTERWEQLGISVDLSNYATQSDLSTGLASKQNTLIAGTNISIIGNTISAQQPNTAKFEMLSGASAPTTSTVGAVGQKYLDTTKNDIYVCTEITDMGSDVYSYTWLLAGGNGKQNKLTAGTNITIDADNVISASGGASNAVLLDNTDQTFEGSKQLYFNNTSDNIAFKHGTNRRVAILPYDAGILLRVDNRNNTKIYYTHISFMFGGATFTINFPTSSGTLALTSDISAKVPDAPDADGTYTLKCVVSSGVKTYQWVLDV